MSLRPSWTLHKISQDSIQYDAANHRQYNKHMYTVLNSNAEEDLKSADNTHIS